ncbi:MAG: PilZ domain-containing protein [Allosphingosinicella sp.]|uniref:PilZ domain-containing protein n=1 Tax=Allosphingosinicella sp. TaxID=2823234 RepID=UPI00394FF368
MGEAALRFEERRAEPRHEGLVTRATLHFRGQPFDVAVLDISSRGTQIESPLNPRLGENVVVEFEACSRMHAFVRWVRDGRIGLRFGHELVIG